MKKSKLWLLSFAIAALGLVIGANNQSTLSRVHAKEISQTQVVEAKDSVRPTLEPKGLVIPDNALPINNATDFNKYFNGGAVYDKQSLYLTDDIDLNGRSFNIGIGGEYSGIFEGNDFTISNFTMNHLFNIMTSSSAIRNVNLRFNVAGSSAAGVCFQNNGQIENVRIEMTIDKTVEHIGGFSRIGGSGTLKDSEVDFIITENGKSSTLNLCAISYQGNLTVLGTCSHYVSVPSGTANPVNAQGLTLRTEPINWGGELPPRVEVSSGYEKKLYVEDDPNFTEVTASVLNADGKTVLWSIDALSDIDEEIATVQLLDNVATVTAIAKGTVSFKFKATIDGEDYLSSLVSIKVLTDKDEYDIPASATEIHNAASFKTFFDKGAAHNNTNAYLSADIDLEGYQLDQGMAGQYKGIFEGQGHKISNYKGKGLFNILDPGSEVRNINIEFEARTGASGAVASINNGLVKNVNLKIYVKTAINSYGGISQAGTGSFVDCRVDWFFGAGSEAANTLHTIVEAASGKNITNCSWTVNGPTGPTTFSNSTHIEITHDLPREAALGFQIFMMGYEGGDVTTTECSVKWSAALEKWYPMSAEAKEQVKTLAEFEDAWARFQRWAVANGSTTDAVPESGSGVRVEKENMLNATLIIGVLGLSTLLGYYFLTKKKA